MKKILYIVVPCYNEEEVIESTARILKEKLNGMIKKNKVSKKSKILFINDGSKDNTLELIENIVEESNCFEAISLYKNRGHQKALYAGLMYCKDLCDVTISIDADLQDDIEVFDEMIDLYYQGNDIVYGVRKERKTDTFFKKQTAILYYKILKKMDVDVIYNHADFRLMSSKSLFELEKYQEKNLYLRGIVPLLGYKSDVVYYDRKKRMAGKSKYSFKKMLNLAIDGITSFSIKPIKLILYTGILTFIVSLTVVILYFCANIFLNDFNFIEIILCFVCLILSIILISIGIIGQYIGKMYIEVKNRPRYNVSKIIKKEQK